MAESYPQRPFSRPPDAKEVILVRHGASADAVPGEPFELIKGRSDPPLSSEGEGQAEALADRLAREPIAALFVTPLQRTALTAAPLADRLGLRPTPVPQLSEVRLGELEGGEFRIRVARGDPVIRRLFDEERWDVIPGAERMEDFGARVREGLERVVAAIGPGAVGVAVVHGGVIAELCRQVTGSRPFAFIGVDNTSITRLVRLGDGRWLLRRFNDTAHLG